MGAIPPSTPARSTFSNQFCEAVFLGCDIAVSDRNIFRHDNAVLAVMVILAPNVHLGITQLLVKLDGSLIRAAHAQFYHGHFHQFFTFQQEGSRQPLAAIGGQDADGEDPAGLLSATDIPGDETNSMELIDRLETHDVRQGQSAHQFDERPGILAETGALNLLDGKEITPGSRFDFKFFCRGHKFASDYTVWRMLPTSLENIGNNKN